MIVEGIDFELPEHCRGNVLLIDTDKGVFSICEDYEEAFRRWDVWKSKSIMTDRRNYRIVYVSKYYEPKAY